MPQTREAIDHAKAAGVPMIVAINKIDKPEANPDKIKRELQKDGILVEEWGGDVISVAVSAKEKKNITELLEMILLLADVLELKANPKGKAQGVVLEARMDAKKGPPGDGHHPERDPGRRRGVPLGHDLREGPGPQRRERQDAQGRRAGHAGRDPGLRRRPPGRGFLPGPEYPGGSPGRRRLPAHPRPQGRAPESRPTSPWTTSSRRSRRANSRSCPSSSRPTSRARSKS